MTGLLDKLIAPVTDLLDKVIPDADKKQDIVFKLATMADGYAQEIALAQIAVNKAEAESASVFKGGWRPFVGWTCGVALAYHFVAQPVIVFAVALLGLDIPPLPAFDMGSLLTVLMGMLGLGGLRTFEKFKGVASK